MFFGKLTFVNPISAPLLDQGNDIAQRHVFDAFCPQNSV